MKKTLFFALALFVSSVVLFSLGSDKAYAGTSDLRGWAWSSNIGWISFNSQDVGAGGGPYVVQVSTTTGSSIGTVSGYAWSSSIGWIKFGGLSGFPSGGSNATIDFSNGKVEGWARACAGTINGNCSTMESRTDGWDGWISLSGTNFESPDTSDNGKSAKGITLGINPAQTEAYGKLTGFAWGGDVVGWVSFSPIAGVGGSDGVCVGCCGEDCDEGGGDNLICNLSPASTVISSGQSVSLTWSTNATSCTASGGWSGTKNPTGSESFTPTSNTVYNLECGDVAKTPTSCSMSSNVIVSTIPPPSGLRLFIGENSSELASVNEFTPSSQFRGETVRVGTPFALKLMNSLDMDDYSCTTNITNNGSSYWGTSWNDGAIETESEWTLSTAGVNKGDYKFSVDCEDSSSGQYKNTDVTLKVIQSTETPF